MLYHLGQKELQVVAHLQGHTVVVEEGHLLNYQIAAMLFSAKFYIRSAALIDGIQLTYQYSNGVQYTSGYHGGTGGHAHRITINVSRGERVIGVFGRSAALVDSLGFITNWGRIFGPYGGCGGRAFTVHSCKVKGIHGRSAALLDSIGFFCGTV